MRWRGLSYDGSVVFGEEGNNPVLWTKGSGTELRTDEIFLWSWATGKVSPEGDHAVFTGCDGDFRPMLEALIDAGIDLGAFDKDVRGYDISSDGSLLLGRSSDGATDRYWIANIGVVPEPGTGLLMVAGLVSLAVLRRR